MLTSPPTKDLPIVSRKNEMKSLPVPCRHRVLTIEQVPGFWVFLTSVYDDRSGFAVNIAHHSDLSTALRIVFLINADRINPHFLPLMSMPQPSNGCIAVFGDTDKSF